jgi:hypothetical protein
MNKWLQDMLQLKADRNTLKNILTSKGIVTSATQTLTSLIAQVPSLSPIVLDSRDLWEPDQKWVFPDPNGSGQNKTIREIYDEDTMANTYTYRGIYLIQARDDIENFDLKECMNKRTNEDTFILSDGTIYTNITDSSLSHSWDTSKDIIDSKNRAIRYIRWYSNTPNNYLPGFYKTLLWAVSNHKSTAINDSASNFTSPNYATSITESPVQCIEFGDKFTSFGTSGFSSLPELQKITSDNPIIFNNFSNNSCSIFTSCPKLRSLDLKIQSLDMSSGWSYPNAFGNIESITIDPEIFTGNLLRFPKYFNIKRIYGLEKTSITTVYIQGTGLYDLPLPSTVSSIQLNLGHIEDFTIPESVTSCTLSGGTYLRSLRIQSEDLASFSIETNLAALTFLSVPSNWKYSLTLTNSVLLQKEAILGILYNLKDLTSSSAKTLTLGATNLAKLTDEEKAIATNKNWTLA